MDQKIIQDILELSKNRIKYLEKNNSNLFYNGPKTYFDWMSDELVETQNEFKKNNAVFLEDELGDIFWDYICLLNSLAERGFIDNSGNVFQRCYKKFSQRFLANSQGISWSEIKQKQKEELKEEHNLKYGNK